MKHIITLLFFTALLLQPLSAKAAVFTAPNIPARLQGQILLAVEENGEAFYIHPTKSEFYYLGRAADAFAVMREQGIGITNQDLERIPTVGTGDTMPSWEKAFAMSHRGKIFLQVEENGEAWYIHHQTAERYFLGRPSDAYNLMRQLGLGISNTDLINIFFENDRDFREKMFKVSKPLPIPPPPPPSIDDLPEVAANDHAIGPEGAKVTIIVYNDFECPYCKRFHQTMKEVREAYGDNVRWVYRHFPLAFHLYAYDAAEASECAADQGKFWEYADLLFENQYNLSETRLNELAKDLNLNINEFTNCRASNTKHTNIEADIQGGRSAGVNGTPNGFAISGDEVELIKGAMPYSTIKDMIDKLIF